MRSGALFAALGVAVCASLTTLTAQSAPAAYTIDPAASLAEFTVTKLGYSDVTGRFTRMSGEVQWDPQAPERGSIRWRVDVASVVTDEPRRDSAIQYPEYFYAERHPRLTFESRRVRRIDSGTLEVTGDLTIRGATRPLTATVHHRGGPAAPVFETWFEVDRYDFGITGGRIMGRLIGRAVRIHLRAALVPASS